MQNRKLERSLKRQHYTDYIRNVLRIATEATQMNKLCKQAMCKTMKIFHKFYAPKALFMLCLQGTLKYLNLDYFGCCFILVYQVPPIKVQKLNTRK